MVRTLTQGILTLPLKSGPLTILKLILGQGGLALRRRPNRDCGFTPFQAADIRFQLKGPREMAKQHAEFGSLRGTQFMAPEVLRNLGQGYSEKADVW